MKTIRHIFAILAALSALSCTRELIEEQKPVPASEYEGQEVTVYFGVKTPEPVFATKALGEQPNISSIHVAVFGSSGYLKEYKRATPIDANGNEVNEYVSREGETYAKYFKVPLSITSSKIRVHIIANGPETVDFDYESIVMSQMLTQGGDDAYWQRILLNNGIQPDTEAEGYSAIPPVLVIDPDFDLADDGTTHKMAMIPLIRNFAKLQVVAEPKATSNFVVNSFAVVNVPDKGSVAPYNSLTGEFEMDYSSYQTLGELSAVYPGNMPAQATIDKSYPDETDFASLSNGVVAAGGAVYMYERPVPTSDATILIVNGTYTDPDTGSDYTGYYKIDMMDGSDYLPIMRNFRYQVRITKVHRKGMSTVAAAVNGAGSADISADISTASQVNLSDGKSGISVEYTEKTLPIGGTYTLGVTFTKDVANGIVDNSLITYELLPAGANGAVIASEEDISFNSTTGTLTYKTTEVDATKIKEQKIRIIGTSETSRLYRDVTIKLLPKQTMTVSCIPVIEQAAGTEQVVTVSIPKDLPQSIFPLQFKVEIANKTLTPDADDLPVEPGTTIVSGATGNSYQFIKTISYQDYISGYADETSVFTCEFKSIVPVSDSYIYVANDFFTNASTSFTTFVKRYFTGLSFSRSDAVNEDDPVNFSFVMDAAHEETSEKLIPETVDVYLTGLVPDVDTYPGELQSVSGNHYVYSVPAGSAGYSAQTLHLLSTGETANYAVALSATYYEDASKQNVQRSFTSPSFGTVYYGNGWPTTFSFSIPTDYEMPAVGYIDIELNLTNLEPNSDANIVTSGGKYYYRAYSTGTKTMSLKTTGDRRANVAVELVHGDFATLSSDSGRSYITIPANTFNMSFPNNANPETDTYIGIYTDKALSNSVGSTRRATGNGQTKKNRDAISWNGKVIDADQSLYMSYSRTGNGYGATTTTYYATTTAETLVNGGTVSFSTTKPGKITISATDFSTTKLSVTSGGVTVSFSSISGVYNWDSYLYLDKGSTYTLTVTSTSGPIESIDISYYSTPLNSYLPNTVTVSSGGGSYAPSSTTGTWTGSSESVTLNITPKTSNRDNNTRITSIEITLGD